ncbi:MAG: TIR domain-containing protein [Candidatus Cloacimonetes bacterium]|nr:TIR domain-containing protein [Candidatus Cloacimonadota bacterium]
MGRKKIEYEFGVLLSQMVSYLVLTYRSDTLNNKSICGEEAEINERTIFLTARATYALCTAYSFVIKEYLFKEDGLKMNMKEFDVLIENAISWLISKGIQCTQENEMCWWSSDNSLLEIVRTTCAVINALMEYRKILHNKAIEYNSEKTENSKLLDKIEKLNIIIDKGISFFSHNIISEAILVPNASTGDQSLLYAGGLANIPVEINHKIINGNFEDVKVDLLPSDTCEVSKAGGITPAELLTAGVFSMGENFKEFILSEGRKKYRVKYDTWATAEVLNLLSQQLHYLSEYPNGESSNKISDFQLNKHMEELIEVLIATRNREGIWESEFVCANYFIIYHLYIACLELGKSEKYVKTLIGPSQNFIDNLLLKNYEYKNLNYAPDIYLIASRLRDSCLVFGIVLLQLSSVKYKTDIKEFSWFYDNLSSFSGSIPKLSSMYTFVPVHPPQVDKTSWAVICLSKILAKCGHNQRRLDHYRKWAFDGYLQRMFVIPISHGAPYKIHFIPPESQYKLFNFTHGDNIKQLKILLKSNKKVKWIDLGCGKGRNLEILMDISPELRSKIEPFGLDIKNLEEEYLYNLRRLCDNIKTNNFISQDIFALNKINEYDYVTATLVFHEISLGKLFDSLCSVINSLKIGGYFTIIDLIDYYNNESKIITWEMEEMKEILYLFNSSIEFGRNRTKTHIFQNSYIDEEIEYYTIVVKKVKNLDIDILDKSKIFELYHKKYNNLIKIRKQTEDNIYKKIEQLDLKKLIESITTPKERQKIYNDLISNEELINKINEEDILNCSKFYHVCEQLTTLKGFFESKKIKEKTIVNKVILKKSHKAFISYESSLKEIFVRPLVDLLTKEGINVWFDDFEIKIGDSISEKIQEGLTQCEKCILVISPEYIKNKSWAKREFKSITALEMQREQNMIIPVWFEVTRNQVMELSHHLGDIKGNKADDLDELVNKLVNVLR